MPQRSHARLLRDQSGQTMTEYIIVVILVALAVVFSMGRFHSALGRKVGCGSAQASEFDVDDKKFPDARGLPTEECTGFVENVGAGGSIGAD